MHYTRCLTIRKEELSTCASHINGRDNFWGGKTRTLTHNQVIPKRWSLWYLFSVCVEHLQFKKKKKKIAHIIPTKSICWKETCHWTEELQKKNRGMWLTFSVFLSFLNTDMFQNILRYILIFNMGILEQTPILVYICSSKFASKWEREKKKVWPRAR